MGLFWQIRILRALFIIGFAISGLGVSADAVSGHLTGDEIFTKPIRNDVSSCVSCHGDSSKKGFIQPRFLFVPPVEFSQISPSLSTFTEQLKNSSQPTMQKVAMDADHIKPLHDYLMQLKDEWNPAAKIVLPSSPAVAGRSYTLDGQSSVPQTNLTYTWTVYNPNDSSGTSSPTVYKTGGGPTFPVTFPTADTYKVELSVKSTRNEQHLASTNITVNPAPVATIGPHISTVEAGTPFDLDISGSTPTTGVTYKWEISNPSGSVVATGLTAKYRPTLTATGTYGIKLTVKVTATGETATDNSSITVTAAPVAGNAVIASSATSVEAGGAINFDGRASTPSGVSYQWSVFNSSSQKIATGSAATFSHTFLTADTYLVELIVTPSGGGATGRATKSITVTAAPLSSKAIISSPATTVVAGSTLTINGSASTPVNAVTYQWSVQNPAGVTTVAGSAATQNVTFSTTGTYKIFLTVQPSAGGTANTNSIEIVVTAPPAVVAQAIITSPPTSVVVGTTLTLSGTTSTPANQVTYQWSVRNPANVTTTAGTAATQNVTFATVGTYRVTLAVQPTAGGNVSTTFADIEVTPTPVVPAPIYSPSGFDALVRFAAAANSSQTLCPTIQNSGTAPLTLSVAAVQAGGSSADFSNYFELGDSTSCPATPRPCLTTAAGSPVTGTTTLQPASDSACTLALRFNPAKLGAGGGIGVRTATLRVTHNAPSGTVVDVPMSGNVTAVPQPAIGLFTNPGADASGHVSPPAFASQPVSSASAQWSEFQVFNSGDADGLDLTEVANSNAQEFALTENCVNASPLARLSAGTEPSCTISLRFTPGAVGQRCTTITIRAAVSSNGAQSRQVCGTGVAAPSAALTLSADAIDFGRRFISASYPPRPLVISNGVGATDNLQINDVRLSGTGFALLPDSGSSQTPCAGRTLAPGASCTVQVQFTPDPTRPETPYSASIQIDSNDRSTPRRTVTLAAVAGTVATPPVLQTPGTPAQIEFTSVVMAGQQSQQPLSVPLRNAGPGAATIDTIRMVGADASSFSASGCQATLQEGDSCTISVRFVPGSGGLKRAQLEVLSSRSVAPPLITVTGRGVGGSSAFLAASAANLAMGSVRVGARSEPAEVRLSSGGDGVVQVTAIEAGGPFTVQPKTCPAPPFTLPRGGDCTVTVTFTPTNADVATASLRVSTDAGAVTVPLTGSGAQSAEVSSGGCSLVSGDAPFDPTLLILVGLAFAALLYRRCVRASRRRQP